MTASGIGTALIGAAVVGASVFGAPASARADPHPATCLFAPQVPHRVDASLRRRDAAAPATPVVVSVDTFRRNGMTCTSASCVSNSCGSTGTVRIDLAPSADDVTPPQELGYRLILVRGEVPDSMRASIGVPLAAGHVLYLRPGFEELPLLDVELAAVAIDAAGNESTPTEPFAVRFDGCTLAAVGDRCEDELAPDADLASEWNADLGDTGSSDPSPEASAGVSCSLGSERRPAPGSIAVGLGLLGSFFAWRRTRRANSSSRAAR